MKKIILTIVLMLGLCSHSFAAVSSEVLLNAQDPTATSSVISPIRVKDAGKMTGDSITQGIIAMGGLVFNGTNWDRLRGDATNGMFVQIKAFNGGITPSDAFANPTNAMNSNSLLSGFNGTTWDRIRAEGTNADADAVLTLGALATESYQKVFNGTSWDRRYSGIILGSALTDNSSNAANNITTSTTTTVKGTGGVLNRIIVNTAGTGSTVSLYNIAAAGCTGTPGSGFIGTLATTTASVALEYNHTFTLGICVVTTGAPAANLSVLYR